MIDKIVPPSESMVWIKKLQATVETQISLSEEIVHLFRAGSLQQNHLDGFGILRCHQSGDVETCRHFTAAGGSTVPNNLMVACCHIPIY